MTFNQHVSVFSTKLEPFIKNYVIIKCVMSLARIFGEQG